MNKMERVENMTICIGAICEKRAKAVCASDRMITSRQLLIEFEHNEPKFEILTKKCLALTAGEALPPTEIFRKARTEIQDSPRIAEIAVAIEKNFASARMKRVEDLHFKPRGLTLQNFIQAQRVMNPNVVLRLDRTVETTKMNLQVLIVGVDMDGGHLFQVVDPGHAECFDRLGFHAVGSGLPHAVSTLITYNYTPQVSLKEATYIIYEAKRNAEKAPGVGKAIDMAILDDQGIRIIKPNEIDLLEKIYQARLFTLKAQKEKMEEMISGLPF